MQNETRWMLYGATGFTGPLVIEEAIKRGHRPLLAGRSEEKLKPLAKQYGLDYVAFSLDDVNVIADHIADVDIVFHAAGPYVWTAEPMLQACLQAGKHYLDLTGEIAIFENTFAHDAEAREKGIMLLSGAGFDVIPTDCMAAYVAGKVPDAVKLETGVLALNRASAGTTKSLVEMLPLGGRIRRDGELLPQPLGAITRRIPFPTGESNAMSIPWGDLSVAYRSTGIPNITCYIGLPSYMIPIGRAGAGLSGWLFGSEAIRKGVNKLVDIFARGPNEHMRKTLRAYVWARAEDSKGNYAEAWLETCEAYRFTAIGGVRAVEKMADLNLSGALTPSQAFGADFVLELDETYRYDSLNGARKS